MSQREKDATENTAKMSKHQIIEQFGVQEITHELVDRFYKLTHAEPHPFLSRFLYFAHRDFDKFLDAYEQGRPVYLYTGRGPSSDSLHLGHMIPFFFCAYLQKAFDCPIVIYITDDEKLLRDPSLTFEQVRKFALLNITDIVAVGFDLKKTFIYLNSEFIYHTYKFEVDFSRQITLSQLRGAFGFEDSYNVGYVSYPAKQMLPAFYNCFPEIFTREYCEQWRVARGCSVTRLSDLKQQEGETNQQFEKRKLKMSQKLPEQLTPFCLIPCGYEQEPYWRVCRDVAPRIGLQKPATIYNCFIPALQGTASKMSASDPSNAVYMDDSAAYIKKKINKYAFSGGQATVEEQRAKGADVDLDVSIKYLEVFMADGDELARIKEKYARGEILTGEVKGILIEVLQKLCGQHYEKKAYLSEEFIRQNVFGWGRTTTISV